ncbi:hypothetical protein Tco_0199218 [Tanacetum coccineum]
MRRLAGGGRTGGYAKWGWLSLTTGLMIVFWVGNLGGRGGKDPGADRLRSSEGPGVREESGNPDLRREVCGGGLGDGAALFWGGGSVRADGCRKWGGSSVLREIERLTSGVSELRDLERREHVLVVAGHCTAERMWKSVCRTALSGTGRKQRTRLVGYGSAGLGRWGNLREEWRSGHVGQIRRTGSEEKRGESEDGNSGREAESEEVGRRGRAILEHGAEKKWEEVVAVGETLAVVWRAYGRLDEMGNGVRRDLATPERADSESVLHSAVMWRGLRGEAIDGKGLRVTRILGWQEEGIRSRKELAERLDQKSDSVRVINVEEGSRSHVIISRTDWENLLRNELAIRCDTRRDLVQSEGMVVPAGELRQHAFLVRAEGGSGRI